MKAFVTENIIGSWLFTRSSQPNFTPGIVYHFTSENKCYWEIDHGGKRLLSQVRYRFAGNKITLIYSSGTEHDFELTAEDDGSLMVPSPNGTKWWMVRLISPESYLKAFVDEHGRLQDLEVA